MVVVQHLLSPAALPSAAVSATTTSPGSFESLSVVSYNVLLPNSVDGWWTYKMYMPPLVGEKKYQSSWEYRKAMLEKRLKTMNADIVCFQEVSPKSFEEDFQFMEDLGYDGKELFKKGRFRPATFWKKQYCEPVLPSVHKDRCLLTAFRLTKENRPENTPARNWYIANCHLQAGKNAKRRVRQINEAVRGVMTIARKQKEKDPEKSVRLIVCGDFNGGAECGAVRYLEDGFVDENFIEDGEPVSSGRKELPLAEPLKDVTTTVDRELGGKKEPPPTLVVSELISNLIKEGTDDNPEFCQSMLDRLERVYRELAKTGENGEMSYEDVEKWLTTINGELGRGDEYREAARQMGWKDPNPDASFEEQKARIKLPNGGVLSLDGFIEVYKKEICAGKFWGVAHDMAVLGDPLPDIGCFTARFDRMYYNCAAMQPIAVVDTISDVACPNDTEPSDHLPVAASFQSI